MKHIIRNILFIIVPVFLMVILVNVLIDPANVFKDGSYEDGIAKIILSGYNVTNISNYNERYLQKRLIETGKFKPKLLIIGSSRVMEIGSDFFKGVNLMNNGVSMAVLEDDLAILNIYLKQGIKPQKIILGLDPWTLNDNNPENRWKFVYPSDCFEMFDRIGAEKENKITDHFIINPRYKEMFSFSYFQECLKTKIWYGQNKETVYTATKKKVNNTFTKLNDGSIIYEIKYRSKTPEELKSYVINYSESVIASSLINFNEISTSKINIIRKLIEFCKKNGIGIELLLAPFHPYTYNLLISKPKYTLLPTTEESYIKLANEFSIKIYGSFNPVNLNLPDSVFYDEMHCNESAVKKILNLNE